MQNNIIQQKEVDTYTDFLGAKTINLKKCSDWGFSVPKFIALPSNLSEKLFSNTLLRKEVSQEIPKYLKSAFYAVRSSALVEDGTNQSYAGQFQTKLPVSENNLDQAIYSVLEQANGFLKSNLESFSLLIQEYIPADISGITFTRNPNGNREMILEYGLCKGENLVSGSIKPEKISLAWSDPFPKNAPLSFTENSLTTLFQKLETKNGFPQDIEWCIANNIFYLLQTRPITTISKKQYQQILFLEKTLPKNKKYFFEKTEISEIAPRPSTLTQNLLHRIYSNNGPIHTVYKKYGICYKDTDFLKIIGNELYINKEKEIKSILPAYSYLKNKSFTPEMLLSKEIFRTFKNIFFLNTIPSTAGAKLFSLLKTSIESPTSQKSNAALKEFLDDYALIFEVNLLTGIALKKATLLLRKEPVSFLHIPNASSLFIDLEKYQIAPPDFLCGNILEFSDTSKFTANILPESKKDPKVFAWWKTIPEHKKNLLKNPLAQAVLFNRLREFGRWLMLKNKATLQTVALTCAKKNNFQDPKNIFFSPLEDILNNHPEESICLKNKKTYENFEKFSFPNILTSSPISSKSKIFGVSPGHATGVLQNTKFFKTPFSKNERYILCTEILSPDLAQYFDDISGIISNNGGILSHLAILAREKNIPVIVGFSLNESSLKLGDRLRINGETGEIQKIA